MSFDADVCTGGGLFGGFVVVRILHRSYNF